jgi:hypothetical protein
MRNILRITRLNFIALINVQILICAGVLLLHLLISMAVIRLANTEGPAGVGDGIVLVTVPILGIIFFSPSFKYSISQGISRKTFFMAGSLTIFFMAAAFAVLTEIFYLVNLKTANVWMIYKLIYAGQVSLIGLILWEFGALLFLGMAGWCIRLIYYVSNRAIKYAFSITPFVLSALLIFFNALADGGIGRAIWRFLKTTMGLSGSVPNPYIGIASMLGAATILGLICFLLLRRAQIID